MLHGSGECAVPCEIVSGRGYVGVYRPPFAICRVRIGRQVAHPDGQYITIKGQISQCPSAGRTA